MFPMLYQSMNIEGDNSYSLIQDGKGVPTSNRQQTELDTAQRARDSRADRAHSSRPHLAGRHSQPCTSGTETESHCQSHRGSHSRVSGLSADSVTSDDNSQVTSHNRESEVRYRVPTDRDRDNKDRENTPMFVLITFVKW